MLVHIFHIQELYYRSLFETCNSDILEIMGLDSPSQNSLEEMAGVPDVISEPIDSFLDFSIEDLD